MSPAAAVEVLGGVLVHVKNGAEVTEIPRFGDDELLTEGVVGFECWHFEVSGDTR